MANAAGCYTPTCSALRLPFAGASFDAVCTSPAYGNRMSDHHNARDTSLRHTYRHTLGRPLHPENSGAMQWGEAYRAFHLAAWTEVRRVLKPGAAFVLNCKDHIRHGQLQPVTAWHIATLVALGFTLTDRIDAPCPGQRHGANGHLRVKFESVLLLRRSPEP
jgi:DNA modification methylase